MALMSQRRRELGRLGGRPKKPSREEAREAALERLVPKAVSTLEAQLDSEDERITQVAAVKLLEWGWGKPASHVKEDIDQTVTVFLDPAFATLKHGAGTPAGELIDGEVLELESGEEE